MSLQGFLFIMASAVFHVLWNSFLKASEEKTEAVMLMMVVTLLGMIGYTGLQGALPLAFDLPTLLSAAVAGLFFFLYQFLTAKAYAHGQLSRVYPLTVTGPIYIALWGVLILDETITPTGMIGILSIVYGAMTIQTDSLSLSFGSVLKPGQRPAGSLFALLAAFFYSFGAIADKLGVTVGRVTPYTLDLCLIMFLLHGVSWLLRSDGARLDWLKKQRLRPILLGGTAMLLSFVTFRVGLQEVQASYASALRQVSTLFGLIIAWLAFREAFGLKRVLSTVCILTGVVLLKLG